MQITEHFSLDEFIFSETAHNLRIDNTPPSELMFNVTNTCLGLEKIRAFLNMPIIILSGYRCEQLNNAVGGEKESQHVLGQAADIICPNYADPFHLAEVLKNNITYFNIDQLILEYNRWVHVSFSDKPRAEMWTRKKNINPYLKGIIE